MNPAYPQVSSPADLDKILALLREYTGTLREGCRTEVDRRYKFTGVGAVTSVTFMFIFMAVFLLFRERDGDRLIPISVAIFGAITIASIIPAYTARFHRYSQDADELANTVARLVEVASQYREHASRRISDKFEFDLRLAEAEGVLETYRRIFKNKHYSLDREG